MTIYLSPRSVAVVLWTVVLAGPARPAEPEPPEWAVKLLEIVGGDVLKAGSSPLAVSKSRYGWEWLAKRHGLAATEKIERSRFRGAPELFGRLDRNGDGALEAADFDWSDRSPFVQQQAVAMALFNRLNSDGNGNISAPEWQALFGRLAGENGSLSAEDLRQALFAAPGRPSVARPTRLARLLGFLTGELGSLNAGPNPGQMAPDFTLRAQDGKRTVRLWEFRDHKPVVLIFGNFT